MDVRKHMVHTVHIMLENTLNAAEAHDASSAHDAKEHVQIAREHMVAKHDSRRETLAMPELEIGIDRTHLPCGTQKATILAVSRVVIISSLMSCKQKTCT